MSIWTLLILGLLFLLYLRCRNGECNKDNIISVLTEVTIKFVQYIIDVSKFAFNRFTDIKWT